MSSRVEVRLPEYNQDCSAHLIFWFKKQGDKVTEGEDLLEYETSKAVVTLEAPASGTLVEVIVQEDEEVSSEQLVAYIEADENQN